MEKYKNDGVKNIGIIMNKVSFSSEEKAEMFDYIASLFYKRNFGQASKADIELLMFHFYLEKLIDIYKSEDGTINYIQCSDYIISKELGISQQRVRNLKVKKQLIYPIEYDWKKALATQIKNARYDKITHKITINIPDPNLYLEIQNFLEENGACVEKQLNSKILQMRAEYYIELAVALEDTDSRKEVIKHIKKALSESGKNDDIFDDKKIGKELLSTSIDISTLILNLMSIISPDNVIFSALATLLKD